MFKELKIWLISSSILFLCYLATWVSGIEGSFYNNLLSIFNNILAAILLALIYAIIRDFKFIKLILSILLKRTKYIRFSSAYLFKIQIEDKYLLVRSNRIDDFFQPVGGAYKYFENDSLTKLRVRKDDKLPVDSDSNGDIRLQVPKSNALKFLRWFYKAENREVSCNREFYEELINQKILTAENFPYVLYKKSSHKITDLQYSEHFKCWEILIYDIVEPVLTEKQKVELTHLCMKGNTSKYIWADATMIENNGYNNDTKKQEYRFGTQTKYII